MAPTVDIRRAERGDVDRIVRLTNASGFDGKPRLVLPEVLPEGYFTAFERINKNPYDQLMVAQVQGQIVGTFHLTFLTYLAAGGREDCLVESVHVDAAWRSQGIGTLMMRWAIDAARSRGCRRVQLTSHKMRKDAHRFYQRLGFQLSHEGAKLALHDAESP